MFGAFHPSFEGVFAPERLSDDFADRMAARVRGGLLPDSSRRRNRYEVTRHTRDAVRFRSTSLLTSIAIGWNDVDLRVDRASGRVRYRVTFWKWLRYGLLLGLAIALQMALLVFVPAWLGWWTGDWIREPEKLWTVGLPLTFFFCFVWPFILVALHKRFARRGLESILGEVNSAEPSS